MICLYCGQGEIVRAYVKQTGEKISICDECDTIWLGELSVGENIDAFMRSRSLPPLWSELEILGSMSRA